MIDRCECTGTTWNEGTLRCAGCGKKLSDAKILRVYGESDTNGASQQQSHTAAQPLAGRWHTIAGS